MNLIPNRGGLSENIDWATLCSFKATYVGNGVGSGGFVMAFNNVAYNNGGCYNPTTGRFTAPVKGLYAFTAHCHALGMARMFCSFGTPINERWGEASMGVGTEWSQAGSTQLLMVAGQTVDVSFWFNQTANILDSHFDGHLIRPLP